jgi:hypothetical protein
MARRTVQFSAQDVDPISWFVGRVVPLVFAGLILLYAAFRIPTWFATDAPLLQPIAVLLCAGACVYVYVMTRPLRRRLGWAVGTVTVLIAGVGVVVSAIGYAGTPLSIELWWAPFGLALAISSLAPYLTATKLLVLGALSAGVTSLVSFWFLDRGVSSWGPISSLVIIASPILCGLLASVTFASVIVRRMTPIIEQRSRLVLPLAPFDAEAEQTELLRLSRLSARAVPFLEDVAETGQVSAADRALAGQLARRLRDDLVTQANQTWLDSVALATRLVVIDPQRRAEQMRPAQRTALRGLLQAVLATPGVDSGSLLIELRGRPDGATAVALSMDVDLPEGRRIMHVAPHILTLRTAVEDLTWDARTMSFTAR